MWEEKNSTVLLRNYFPVCIIYFPWSFFTVEHKCHHDRQHLNPWAVILEWFLLWSSLLPNSYCLIQSCLAFQWPFMSGQSGWKVLKNHEGMNAGLSFGNDLPTFVPGVAYGGERRKGLWQCSVGFWMLLLLLCIPGLYRNEDDHANHIEHQNTSQEP